MGAPPSTGTNSIQPCQVLTDKTEPHARASYKRPSGAAIGLGNCQSVSDTTSSSEASPCKKSAERLLLQPLQRSRCFFRLQPLGQLCGNQLVGRLDQRLEFLTFERFAELLFLDPHVARHVWGGNNPGSFNEFPVHLRRALECDCMRPFQINDRKHL